MPVHDVADCNVYYSLTGAVGSFVPLPEAISFGFDSGIENRATIRTFGGKHIRAGDDTDAYDISALFDAAGQAAFRTAKRGRTLVHLILVWDDVGAVTGTRQTVYITSYRWEADADGDFARFRFTAEGEGALTEIVALP